MIEKNLDRSHAVIEHPLDKFIRFLLYVLFFWLPYSEAVIETCVAMALLLWLIKRILLFKGLSQRPNVKWWEQLTTAFSPPSSFLNRPIGFFLLVCVFSVFGSAFLEKSLHGFIGKTLEWFAVYFLVLEVFTQRRHIRTVFFIFMFSALATIFDSLSQFYFTHKDIFRGIVMGGQGATAGFNHPNQLAAFLTFISSIGFSFLFKPGTPFRVRLGFFIFFLLTLWALMITFSRAGWFANIFGISVCLYLIDRRLFKKIFLVGVLIISLFYLTLPMNTKKYFRVDPVYVVQTADWRTDVWIDSLKMIKEAPLFGHGPNTFMDIFQYYRRKPAENVVAAPTYAHNCFIQLTAETGLLGLVGFLWILAALFRDLANRIKSMDGTATLSQGEELFFVCLLIGLFGGAAGFLGHSFLDTDLYSLRISILFWCMIGLSVALSRLKFSSRY